MMIHTPIFNFLKFCCITFTLRCMHLLILLRFEEKLFFYYLPLITKQKTKTLILLNDFALKNKHTTEQEPAKELKKTIIFNIYLIIDMARYLKV